ncbi:MAG: NAD(+)/NADH kinase [Deltaproteobacteria bacterium]
MKIGILTNIEKDIDFSVTKLLSKSLVSHGVELLLPENTTEITEISCIRVNEEQLIDYSDIVISLGGDGTFLRIAKKASKYNKPILGINIGHLGFLTEADKQDIDMVSKLLVEGNYTIKERMLLEGRIVNESNNMETNIALNDVVISRGSISRMINISILLDGQKIDEFPADGLIISTPIGSTAYSLSAGGPIVEPDMKLILVTPICPHTLHARSLILSDERIVTVSVDDKNQNECILTLDGQKTFKLKGTDIIEIKKSQFSLKYIKLPEKNFFDTIRKKLFLRN